MPTHRPERPGPSPHPVDTRRRQGLQAALLWATLGLGACASEPAVKRHTYVESVSTLLLSQDGRQLVVLGMRHHYVFDAPPELVALAAMPLKLWVQARISPFTVASDGTVKGSYVLVLPADLGQTQVSEAQSLGFIRVDGVGWAREGHLSGRRYVGGNTLRSDRVHETLPQTYRVTVVAEETLAQQVAERAVTPVSVTSAGVLLVYLVALAPVLIPVVYLSMEKDPMASLKARLQAP